MDINRENIDQYLFDYFEGDMNIQDSDSLMDFIHQNPSFEKDFVQWKKAYHHVDEKLVSFGFNTELKKIASLPFYYSTWFKITAPTLFIAAASVIGLNFTYFNNLDTDKHLSPTIESLNKKRRPSYKIHSLDPYFITNSTNTSSPEPNKHVIKSTPKMIHKPTAPDTTFLPKPLVINNTDLEIAVDSMNAFPLMNDSLMNETDTIETTTIEHSAINPNSVNPNPVNPNPSMNPAIIQDSASPSITEPKHSSEKAKKRKSGRTTKALPINPNF